MATSPDKLQHLLLISSTLPTSTSPLHSSTGLTLKQLIAVHKSLLDSVFVDITTQPLFCEDSISNEQDQIKRIVKPYVDPKEVDTCVSIISMGEDGNNQKVLLVLQYLLRMSKLRRQDLKYEIDHMIEALTNIAFPLLMIPIDYDSQLRDAILDAALYDSIPSTVREDEREYTSLKEVITRCTQVISSSAIAIVASTSQDNNTLDWLHCVVDLSSRVLIRILAIFDKKSGYKTFNGSPLLTIKEECRQAILNSMHKISLSVLNSICYYSAECTPLRANGHGSTLLRPITALLLPALFPLEEQIEMNPRSLETERRLLEMWAFITNLILSQNEERIVLPAPISLKKCRTWKTTAPAVATGILCVLIPSVQSFSFPVPSSISIELSTEQSPTQRLRLVHQSFLWDFLRNTLKCGVKTSDDWAGIKGGVGFSDMSRRSGRHVDDSTLNVHMLVRRRTIHIMQLLIDKEHSLHPSIPPPQQQKDNENSHSMVIIWKKYMLCFEALEVEKELHLVDQIWNTVLELCVACDKVCEESSKSTCPSIPAMSWEWVGSLLARVLLSESPTLRKLALYRFLSGKAGVSMSVPEKGDCIKSCAQVDFNIGDKTKRGKWLKPAPLSCVTPSFVLEVLLPSYDSLGGSSVGTGVQFEVDGVKRNDDLADLIGPFLTNYVLSLGHYPKKLEEFVAGILSIHFTNGCKTRTLVLIFDAILASWSSPDFRSTKVHISVEILENSVKGLQKLFSGSIIHQLRRSLMNKFATLLSHSSYPFLKPKDPKMLLRVLALFPSPLFRLTEESTKETCDNEEMQNGLTIWFSSFEEKWVSVIGAACAASFVSGDLLPFVEDASGITGGALALTVGERTMGESIVKLCAISARLGKTAASSMLWPAINRGLSTASAYFQIDHLLSCDQPRITPGIVYKTARATLLLESGCNECVLNGIGHGDLIVDKKSEIMLPPPHNIELLLTSAISFILYQINILCNSVGADYISCSSGAARSGSSANLSSHFSVLMDQIMALHRAYPSSVAIPQVANGLLPKLLDRLGLQTASKPDSGSGITFERVRYMSLTFAVLACGAEFRIVNNNAQRDLCGDCRSFLVMTFVEPQTGHSVAQWQLKALRSIFQLAKWGALSYLVPLALSSISSKQSVLDETCNVLFENALESVNAAPPGALLALFETSVIAAGALSENQRKGHILESFTTTMNKILDTLFSVMDDTLHNPTRTYMLEKMCRLIFRSHLLLEEYSIIRDHIEQEGKYNENTDTPILKAFHRLVKTAGIKKPYILKYVLSYITVGWLGVENIDDCLYHKKCEKRRSASESIDHESQSSMGLAAIPYREDIAKLLIHKEMKLNENGAHQEGLVNDLNRRRDVSNDNLRHASIPVGTHETSTARAFLLVFLFKLPDVGNGLSTKVLSDLCHYLIFWLLDNVTCCPTPERGSALMTGSVNYSRKIRAWQSLCLLVRFVTANVAKAVIEKVFVSMKQTIHGQIRYFLEAFTIQCARLHPEFFQFFFVKEICRYDLPQQLLSSLMIIGGNLIVGRYTDEFLNGVKGNEKESTLRAILSGVIPWLGSTQGFCRAIAQLFAHKLIPHVLCSRKIETQPSKNCEESDWFLKSIFDFLDVNPEMKRLRQKQSTFFYHYDVDSICTPEGILNLSVDEGGEANPSLLVDIVKQCLIDIYQEGHGENTPNWKQIEDLTLEDSTKDVRDINEGSGDSLVNFQRKILPLDSLNLALERHKQENLQNAVGRKRQSLIVCATLIDKVPNLAGLARTAEIFAAEKLILPDLRVCKMDNFRSISVTAGDWIDIEECGEECLLSWLKQRKDDGYTVVGVEQTSSSKCLSSLSFPKQTVLLLGKEKEGIPVKYLQMVDICVEIPQLGIIRSLNVHVSGAIAIWEYSKQMME